MTTLAHGSIRATFSDAANMGMFSVGPDGFLYSFTYVFPWCVDLLDEGANCAMTDTTFRILKPYTLAILTLIFANESIPIAFSVSPTEDAESYLSMYNHVIDILCEQIPTMNRRDNLLTRLPLVSDMGRAIQKLVRERHLTWLICHRHLIESVGSHSPIGQWVRRLLRCSSEDEYLATREVIKLELDGLFPKMDGVHTGTPRHFQVLQMMLDLIPPDEIHLMERWARWLRLGCLTTSNALESTHGHLNAHLHSHPGFVERMTIVVEALAKRYYERNSWAGTARKRNEYRFTENDRGLWKSEAWSEFYRRLHTRHGASSFHDLSHFREPPKYWLELKPHHTQVDETSKEPPASWSTKDDQPRAKHGLSVNINGKMSLRHHQAYEIALALCRCMGASSWSEFGASITAQVLDLSAQYGNQETPLTPDQEATWRTSCWRLLPQLPDPAIKTGTGRPERSGADDDSSQRDNQPPFSSDSESTHGKCGRLVRLV
jgi:hypothetical protein